LFSSPLRFGLTGEAVILQIGVEGVDIVGQTKDRYSEGHDASKDGVRSQSIVDVDEGGKRNQGYCSFKGLFEVRGEHIFCIDGCQFHHRFLFEFVRPHKLTYFLLLQFFLEPLRQLHFLRFFLLIHITIKPNYSTQPNLGFTSKKTVQIPLSILLDL
jgi:hypothetical protein